MSLRFLNIEVIKIFEIVDSALEIIYSLFNNYFDKINIQNIEKEWMIIQWFDESYSFVYSYIQTINDIYTSSHLEKSVVDVS